MTQIAEQGLAEIIRRKTEEIEAATGRYFPYRCRPCIEGDRPVPSSFSEKWVHPAWLTGRVVCGYSDLLNAPSPHTQDVELALVCLGLDAARRIDAKEAGNE